MATNNSWGIGYNPLPQSTMNSKLVFGSSDAFTLGNKINSISLSGLIYGDWEQFTSSFMAYPFTISAEGDEGSYSMTASGVSFPDVTCKGHLSDDASFGAFTLGEYKYKKCTSYLDFEPYTIIQVFLPFYGFASLKIADIDDKYIQFRLNVDWSSGQAVYTISTSDVAVNDTAKAPFIDFTNKAALYQQCRVINVLTFQLGYSVPINNTNFNNTIRNMATMAIKTGMGLVSGISGDLIPSSHSASVTKTTQTVRNPETGRQITSGTSTTNEERNTYSRTNGLVNTAIESAVSVINNLSMYGGTDRPNNMCLIGNVCRSIAIIKRSVKPTLERITDPIYKHTVGLPNSTCTKISTLTAYTTVSAMHTDGITALSSELDMLVSAMQEGVIL